MLAQLESQIICPVSLREIQALKNHRAQQLTPQEFLARHPGADANLLAIAAGASLPLVYSWGAIRGKREGNPAAQPQTHHLILLAEASNFLLRN